MQGLTQRGRHRLLRVESSTYSILMRLIYLKSRTERRAWKVYHKDGYGEARGHYWRAHKINAVISNILLKLQGDVNTLNTALRDREESR